MIAKRLAAIIHPSDAKVQCRACAECHRPDGHTTPCATIGVVVAEHVAREAKALAAWLRGAS